MATIDDIIAVQIALQSAGVARGNFGTPIIVGPHMAFADRVRAYTSYADAVTDALPPAILAALSDCFGQTPRPSTVKVGRRDVLEAIVSVPTLTALKTYSITVGAQTYSYTADASPLASEIVTGLAAAITTDSDEIISAVVVGDTLKIAWLDGDILDAVSLGSGLEWGLISPLATGTPVADDLTAILDADANWYGLVMVERIKATQLAAAEWAEANARLFVTASAEAGILVPATVDDLFSQLQAARYFRTVAIYSANAATQYPDAALAGRVFTIAPGGETWALKQLASVTADNLTTTQRNAVIAKGGNTFEFYQESLALTNPGKTSAGEWVDVIRFRDWLKDTIQANMAAMLVNRDKVPYTDGGIQLCATNLRASLQQGQDAGGIAPDEIGADGKSNPGFTVTVPLAAEVSANDKAARTLNLSFAARIAGAIHVVEVAGSLAYEL